MRSLSLESRLTRHTLIDSRLKQVVCDAFDGIVAIVRPWRLMPDHLLGFGPFDWAQKHHSRESHLAYRVTNSPSDRVVMRSGVLNWSSLRLYFGVSVIQCSV